MWSRIKDYHLDSCFDLQPNQATLMKQFKNAKCILAIMIRQQYRYVYHPLIFHYHWRLLTALATFNRYHGDYTCNVTKTFLVVETSYSLHCTAEYMFQSRIVHPYLHCSNQPIQRQQQTLHWQTCKMTWLKWKSAKLWATDVAKN